MISELSKALIFLALFAMFSLAGHYLLSLLVYVTARAVTGGYHAKTYWGCFFATLAIFLLSVFSGRVLEITFLERSLLLLAALFLTLVFAPVRHKNTRAVNVAKRDRFKLLSIALIAFWGGVSCLLPDSLGVTAAVTVFLEALMQPVGVLFNPEAKYENGVLKSL
jgi:accessory gene regulator B